MFLGFLLQPVKQRHSTVVGPVFEPRLNRTAVDLQTHLCEGPALLHEFLERLEVAHSAQIIFRAERLDAIQPFEMGRIVERPLRLSVRPNLELEVRSGRNLSTKNL